MNRRRAGGLVFLVLSGLYGWAATDIPSLPIDAVEAMNARSLPICLAGLGLLLSLLMIAYPGRDGRETPSPAAASGDNWRTVAHLVAGILVYAIVLDRLGFLLSTAAFLAAGFVILGERRWRVVLLLPAVLVGVLWLILVPGLGIYLAPGSVFRVLAGMTGA